ncbi:MAG: preprotein translocase subunit SecE [Pseudonocardiaceae bacterium]
MSDDRAHETDDRLEDAEASAGAPQPGTPARRARTSSRSERAMPPSGGVSGKGHPTRARGATETRAAPPARLMRFLREVVSELRKVIWPSRRELVVYTAVVLVFVSFMVAFVALLDMGLGRAVLTVFG